MYDRETVLELKVPKWRPLTDGEPGDWQSEGFDAFVEAEAKRRTGQPKGEIFPYNRVQVINQSPVSHASTGEWGGSAAQGVLIQPLSAFAAVLDEPLGKLQALYTVTSVPEPMVVNPMATRNPLAAAEIRGVGHQPTPEDVFAEKAPGVAPAEGQSRGRTPMQGSPLADPRKASNASPLG